MKTNYNLLKSLAIALFFSCNSWGQTIITQWNFNGASDVTVPGGVLSPAAATGTGTALKVGDITPTFASGIASGGSSDPVITSPNNFGWHTTNYAALGTENKQRGVQFNVSTVGFQGITFKFDQRLSNSSNNTYVVQYTTDISAVNPEWIDAQTFTQPQGIGGSTGGDVWHNMRTVDLSTVTGLNNNANAAFRIVSAFDPNTGNYLSSSSVDNKAKPVTYATTGTVRYDMVTISANVVLGVSQFETTKNSFKVYPNPSNKEIVRFNQVQDINVYDILGKVILNAKNTSSIDTKTFNTGVYFIKTASGITRKLIVN